MSQTGKKLNDDCSIKDPRLQYTDFITNTCLKFVRSNITCTGKHLHSTNKLCVWLNCLTKHLEDCSWGETNPVNVGKRALPNLMRNFKGGSFGQSVKIISGQSEKVNILPNVISIYVDPMRHA